MEVTETHPRSLFVILNLSYRWLFFLEGIVTVIVATTAFYIIPDFPSTPASWLTPEEQLLAKVRMEEDLHGLKQSQLKQADNTGFRDALTDWKIWWLGISLSSMVVALSFGNFFPTLSATMGYSPSVSLLLCAPPWLFGTATSFFITRSALLFDLQIYPESSLQTLGLERRQVLAHYRPSNNGHHWIYNGDFNHEYDNSLHLIVSFPRSA